MSLPTPHAPLGAHASFNFGPVGAAAGFAVPASAPIAQDLYVGCRHSPAEPWSLLPFFAPAAAGPQPLAKGRFGRFLAWSGDKWMIGPLVFKLCTPFDLAAAPADESFACAPVVCAYLEYDNTHSPDAVELVFGLGAEAAPLGASGLAGFAFGDAYGFAAAASPEVTLRRDVAIFDTAIGSAAALHFSVPPHAKRLYPLVLAFHSPGLFAAKLFPSLSDSLAYGLAQHARYLALSDARDAEFMRSNADFARKTQLALDTRAWLAQSRRGAGDAPLDLAGLRDLAGQVTG